MILDANQPLAQAVFSYSSRAVACALEFDSTFWLLVITVCTCGVYVRFLPWPQQQLPCSKCKICSRSRLPPLPLSVNRRIRKRRTSWSTLPSIIVTIDYGRSSSTTGEGLGENKCLTTFVITMQCQTASVVQVYVANVIGQVPSPAVYRAHTA